MWKSDNDGFNKSQRVQSVRQNSSLIPIYRIQIPHNLHAGPIMDNKGKTRSDKWKYYHIRRRIDNARCKI